MACLLCDSNAPPELKAQKNHSKQIDQMLSKHGKVFKQEIKILLLGPGESGKSTVFKQMKIIQTNGGFKDDELASYKYIVFGNCITQMKVIVSAATKLGIDFDNQENRERAQRIAKLPAAGDAWNQQVGEDVKVSYFFLNILDSYRQLNFLKLSFFFSCRRFGQILVLERPTSKEIVSSN